MHFSQGAPLRILADARDPNAWQCPPGHPPYVCPGTEVRFYVDGQWVGSASPDPVNFNLWELRMPQGLTAGDHVINVTYVPYDPASGSGGTPVNGVVAVTIHIDPPPTQASTVTLTGDLTLTGSADLDWTGKRIVGNGHRVVSGAGYSGRVIIKNAYVSGLGSYTARGMDVTTSGSITVQNSIFEATGAVRLAPQGGASLSLTGNEFRSNNLIDYVSGNPEVPVVLQLDGGAAGAKTLQGNRIGAGIVLLNGGSAWQIGGLGAGQGNIFMGPRAVLEIMDSTNDKIQGNYLLHDYHGGFSQGFNLWMQGSSGRALAEHNVILGGSWPVQSFGGEFRYNLVVNSGHTFWRSAADNTLIHHNLFVHATGTNTQYDGAIQVYEGESGLVLYNNTFDLGGSVGDFNAPALNIGAGSLFASVRNNLFTSFVDVPSSLGSAFITTPDGAPSAPRVSYADYNAWFNPLATSTARYRSGIVAGGAGSHDVQANPVMSGSAEMPYKISNGCVWKGDYALLAGPFLEAHDDDHHVFRRGEPVEICSKTLNVLAAEGYAPHFAILNRASQPVGGDVVNCAPTGGCC